MEVGHLVPTGNEPRTLGIASPKVFRQLQIVVNGGGLLSQGTRLVGRWARRPTSRFLCRRLSYCVWSSLMRPAAIMSRRGPG